MLWKLFMGGRPFWLKFFFFLLSHSNLCKAGCLYFKLYFTDAVRPYRYITQLFVKVPALDFTSDTCSFVLSRYGRQISTETVSSGCIGRNELNLTVVNGSAAQNCCLFLSIHWNEWQFAVVITPPQKTTITTPLKNLRYNLNPNVVFFLQQWGKSFRNPQNVILSHQILFWNIVWTEQFAQFMRRRVHVGCGWLH